jgi:hypothetical protein
MTGAASQSPSPRLRRRERFDFLYDLSFRGEATFFVFGEDLGVPDGDIERSAGTADELRVDVEFFFERGRQTGGSGEVVSDYAVFDDHVHEGRLLTTSFSRALP